MHESGKDVGNPPSLPSQIPRISTDTNLGKPGVDGRAWDVSLTRSLASNTSTGWSSSPLV